MKIAVTGGSGFIGRQAVDYARKLGHEAWSFDRTNGHDILGDLGALGDAEMVIHCAGMLGTSELFECPETAIQVNVVGSLRVLNWCRDHRAGYVGITMPDVFPSVYTATRACTKRLGTAYHYAYGMPVSRVCAFNAFGPFQAVGSSHPQKIIPTFACKAWRGEPIPIWGDGTQTVDLVHSADVGRMLVEAAAFGDDSTFDAGTGVSVSVNEVAEFVLKVTGSTAGVEHLPMRPGELPTRIVAEGRGWNLLGWHPELDWDQVAETVEWYHDRAESVVW